MVCVCGGGGGYACVGGGVCAGEGGVRVCVCGVCVSMDSTEGYFTAVVYSINAYNVLVHNS